MRIMKTKTLVVAWLAAALAAATLVSQARPQASAQLPDTPAAHQFSAWLTAFNSGDRATLSQFLEKNYPAYRGTIDREMQFRNMTGGFEFVKTEDSTPTRLSATVKERDSDQFAHIDIEVEPADPHHILRIDARAIARPADIPLPRMKATRSPLSVRNSTTTSPRINSPEQFSSRKMTSRFLPRRTGSPIARRKFRTSSTRAFASAP